MNRKFQCPVCKRWKGKLGFTVDKNGMNICKVCDQMIEIVILYELNKQLKMAQRLLCP